MALVVVGLGACASPGERYEFSRLCMGVRTRIVVYATSEASAGAGAAAAFHEVERLDAMMSDYRPASELSRLGEVGLGARCVSDDLAVVLGRAHEIGEASGGAFDPSVGPLVTLWRRQRQGGAAPSEDELSAARARVGLDHWRVRDGVVTLDRPGMKLDLGGIAKGYAAERAGRVLESRGLARCLVALAGDVWAGEAPPGQAGWRVDVRSDHQPEGEAPIATILLRSAGVSTSGDANQFVEVGGVRYSHVMDPRTGRGTTALRSVTVVARRGMDADALSTAILVADASDAPQLAGRFGVGVIVTGAGGEREVHDPAGLLVFVGDGQVR